MGSPGEHARDADWQLFADWCTAAGVDPLVAGRDDVAAFASWVTAAPATMARRLHHIRAYRISLGTSDPCPPPIPDRTEQIAAAGVVLSRALVRGWPEGVRGRRDAYITVLRGHLGLSRARIRDLPHDELTVGSGRAAVDGGALVATDEPGNCPVCGITRWLRVLAQAHGQNWRLVRNTMAGQWTESAEQQTEHDCARPLGQAWRRAPVLIPALDRHGWADEYAPISTRSLTTVASRPPQPALAVDPAPSPRVYPVPDRPWSRVEQAAEIGEWDPLFDRLEDEIERALARTRSLLDSY